LTLARLRALTTPPFPARAGEGFLRTVKLNDASCGFVLLEHDRFKLAPPEA
jgi:hypothetical protein